MFTGESRVIPNLLLYSTIALLFYAMSVSVVAEQWLAVAVLIVGPLGVVLLLGHQQKVLIAWLAGLATVFVYPNNLLANLPGVTVERLLFLAFIGLLVVRLAVDKSFSPKLIFVEKAILVLLAITLVSLLYHGPGKDQQTRIDDALLWFRGLFMPMMTLILVRTFEWDDRHLKMLFWALICAGMYLAICGYLQFFLGADFFRPRYILHLIHPKRVTGTFANAIEYGAFVGTILIIALYMFRQAVDPRARALLLFVMMTLGGAVVLAQGRAVWLGLMLTLAIIVLVDRQARLTIFSMVAVLAAGLAVFLMVSANTMVGDTLKERLNEESPVLNRIAVYVTAVNMISDKPAFGFGFGRYTFKDAKRDYVTSIESVSPQYASEVGLPHNEFLHVTVLTGIVGLVSYLCVLGGVARLLWRDGRAAERDPFVEGFRPYLIGMLILVVLNAQFADLMWFTGLMVLFYFIVGVYAQRRTAALRGAPAAREA